MADMATATKRETPSKAKRPPRPASKPAARPSLRFYHSAELRRKTLSVLDRIERAKDATAHRDELAEVVVELTNDGLDFYFMGPLRLSRAGFVLEQSANVGMKGVQQVMASVVRQVIGRMGSPQLLSVCGSIRKFML
jgi:hypothetical protein